MSRIEKDYTELDFNSVDFDVVDTANPHHKWSWGQGGHPLSDNEFYISSFDGKSFVETRYRLPEIISEMLSEQFRHGGNEAIRIINAALCETH